MLETKTVSEIINHIKSKDLSDVVGYYTTYGYPGTKN